MSCIILKISHEEEVRRIKLEKSEISYSDIMRGISELFPDVKKYVAKYSDDEGDNCTLCEASFKDFVAVSRSRLSQSVTDDATCQATLLLKLQLCGHLNEHACGEGTRAIEEPMHEYDQQKKSETSAEASAVRLVFPVLVADGREMQIEWKRGDDPEQVAAKFAEANGIQEDELAAIVEFVRYAESVTHPSRSANVANEEVLQSSKEPASEDTFTPLVQAAQPEYSHKASKQLKTLPDISARIFVAILPDSMHPLDKEDIIELSENLDSMNLKSDVDRKRRRELLKRLDEIEASLGSKGGTD